MPNVTVRVKGINTVIRELASLNDDLLKITRDGVEDSAEYLMETMQGKMGKYQSTGGTNGGSWAQLKQNTVTKKSARYGSSVANKPLVASGKMKDSFRVIKAKGSKTLAASVTNDDPKMIHHVYGAPRAGLPPRDTMLVTAVEEADAVAKIIERKISKEFDKYGN